ncbi:MAG: sialidase family protein [Chloroflexota bacterium]|jgi:hypothetical protein
MTATLRVGRRAPFMGLAAAVLALLLLPALALAVDWTPLDRVTSVGGSRLDSLHQLAAAKGELHLVHPRIGSGKTDDRVVYQRSGNDGRSWTRERVLFSASTKRRHVVPNLAIDARDRIVVVAYRVSGPAGHDLLVRVSRDGGRSFGKRRVLFRTSNRTGIGVPAVAIGNDVIAVAWTDRANGKVKLRTSRDDGRSFGSARAIARTSLSIDCTAQITDGLVGLAINDRSVHVAWSHAPGRQCYASAIRIRTSLDRGNTWSPVRTITERNSFGWPELDARGKTVLATVQAINGGLVVARSGRNGRNWRDELLKPPKGHVYSAADVVLTPGKRAWIAYVKERIRNDKLVSTRLVTRKSANDGRSYGQPQPVTRDAKLLRMAPNLAANDGRVALVTQSGQLDRSPRHIYASRRR